MKNLKFPKLTPHNYATWSIKMWCQLMHNEVSQYVDGTLAKPIGDQVSRSEIYAWESTNRKSLGDIMLGMKKKSSIRLRSIKHPRMLGMPSKTYMLKCLRRMFTKLKVSLSP